MERKTQLLRQILEAGFAGGESLAAVREKLGIDGETWEAWLRDGGVAGDVVTLAKAMAEMCAPWVWSSLLGLARDGSIPAMKLYFELCKEKQIPVPGELQEDREIFMLRRNILDIGGTGQNGVAADPGERPDGTEDGGGGCG